MAQRVKNPSAIQETQGSIPGSGRFPGAGNGNLLQYSRLKVPMDREAWWATVPGLANSQMQLSTYTNQKKAQMG